MTETGCTRTTGFRCHLKGERRTTLSIDWGTGAVKRGANTGTPKTRSVCVVPPIWVVTGDIHSVCRFVPLDFGLREPEGVDMTGVDIGC
jgi:hypothetical protein